MKLETEAAGILERVRTVLDEPRRRYRELNGAANLGEYLAGKAAREDEELLTEPILENLLRRVLGFPLDAFFPQLGRGGLKPDFTPTDLIAHPFVLDAKSSTQRLDSHEGQIRRYIEQRRLTYGVLFNLREVRVYRRGAKGHDPDLSFQLLPLWRTARGEALPEAELGRLLAFRDAFRHREMDLAARIERIRVARSWSEREAQGEALEVDLDFLVDRLRQLSRQLAEDAAAQWEVLSGRLALSPGLERNLLRELEVLALDIAPGTDIDNLPKTIAEYRASQELPGRVWRQYLLRVSQLALTRILLYRSWEDVGFVQESLYDGGFGQVYDRVGQSVQTVLREAFAHGRERYRWLYGEDNNYDWYRPGDEALIDVLYALVPVPLGKLDADVLGGLYESYVDEIDRDRLGQFYTPRAVVRFMLDRADFKGAEGVFQIEGDARNPRRVLDFATGSGGFLVEATRRIIEEIPEKDERAVGEGLAAVARGITGAEISPFPYYLTEVNLLLQVSRLLGRMRVAGREPEVPVLGVVHADTLDARRGAGESLEGLAPGDRHDRAELDEDERFGIVPLDSEKREAFRRMREDDAFDLVIGNPPYVFESNNKILFDRLRSLPGWRNVYRGKSDYLYYFLQLAAEKVAPGGRMCVITPAGWMNAGAADWLRAKLAETLRLDELFLFGSYRLFAPERTRARDRSRAPTPTVESAILLATKGAAPKGHKLRVVALEDEQAAAAALSDDREARSPQRDKLLAEMGHRADGRAGRRKGIHVHSIRQDELVAERPWPIKHAARDVAARVVAHLQQALDSAEAPVERLAERWEIFQGIQTGADAYTARIQRRLPVEVKDRLAATGATTGDPILELPPGTEHQSPWRDHPEVLARSPESRALLYGAIDEDDYGSLVWLGRDDDVPEPVVSALERWRQVLATRAEIARNPRRHWWETAWPRDKAKLRGPKVIALYRTDRGRFALDEEGQWQPSIKTTLVTPTSSDLSVAYLCGLLNSELLDLWYGVRGKTPRDIWRNYEPKPMAEIPCRHVGEIAAGRADALAEAVAAKVGQGDNEAAAELVADLGRDLSSPSDAAIAAAALESIVRAIASNRTELLQHRAVVPTLGRTVKDPWRTGPSSPDEVAAISELPEHDVVSVRVDSTLTATFETDGALGRATLTDGALVFKRARQVTARVEGPEERLAVLLRIVEARPRMLPGDLESLRLPRDLNRLRESIGEREVEVKALLDAGRLLVETAERLVCRLYGLSEELEDAVIAHATERAARSEAPAGD